MDVAARGGVAVLDVIVPTKDRPEYLAEALASIQAVAAQVSDVARINLVVVDDGVDSETVAVAARCGARWMRNSGKGPSGARNTGIRATSAEFIAFLDDDDVWFEGHVVPHLAVLLRRPEVAMVYAQGVLTDAELHAVYPPAPVGPLPSGDVFAYFLGQCISFNTIVVRRCALQEIGLFDETLQSSEDWDLILRIAARFDCAGVEIPVSAYRQSAANAKDHRAWQAQLVTTLDVVGRGSRRATRSRVPLQRKSVATLAIRGWFAYRMTESAQTFLRRGDRREALRCLSAAVRASPLHAALRVSGFWPTLIRCLAISARPAATT